MAYFDTDDVERIAESLEEDNDEKAVESLLIELFETILPNVNVRPMSGTYLTDDAGLFWNLPGGAGTVLITVQVQ